MRRTLTITLCALLSACAHAGIQPDKVTVRTVTLPVPVACAADPGVKPPLTDPKAFADAVAAARDIFTVAQVYAESHMEDADWIARLEAANTGCRAQTDKPY